MSVWGLEQSNAATHRSPSRENSAEDLHEITRRHLVHLQEDIRSLRGIDSLRHVGGAGSCRVSAGLPARPPVSRHGEADAARDRERARANFQGVYGRIEAD